MEKLIFHRAIQKGRELRELTRKQLGDKLGVSYMRVYQMETNIEDKGISERVFLRAAKALGMTPLELLGCADR